MTLNGLLKKPVEIIVENDISKDVIKPADKILTLLQKITAALASDKPELDFLFIYTADVDDNYPVNGVITYGEVDKLLDTIQAAVDAKKETIGELELESKFPLKYFVKKSDPIERVYGMFQTGLTDTVIVLDDNQNYCGKIRRTFFVDRTKKLLA